MMKIAFTLLFLSALNFAVAQPAGVHAATPGADTLKEGVYHWIDLKFKKDAGGGRAQLLDGNTTDLTSLEIHVTELDPGKAPHPPHTHADMEELIVVKEGDDKR